jgi:hypothetical protein
MASVTGLNFGGRASPRNRTLPCPAASGGSIGDDLPLRSIDLMGEGPPSPERGWQRERFPPPLRYRPAPFGTRLVMRPRLPNTRLGAAICSRRARLAGWQAVAECRHRTEFSNTAGSTGMILRGILAPSHRLQICRGPLGASAEPDEERPNSLEFVSRSVTPTHFYRSSQRRNPGKLRLSGF